MPSQKRSKSRSRKTSVKSQDSTAADRLSHSALQLIDQAAELLKKGVIIGTQQNSEERKAIKEKAITFVEIATQKLTEAVEKGSESVRKGIKKL